MDTNTILIISLISGAITALSTVIQSMVNSRAARLQRLEQRQWAVEDREALHAHVTQATGDLGVKVEQGTAASQEAVVAGNHAAEKLLEVKKDIRNLNELLLEEKLKNKS